MISKKVAGVPPSGIRRFFDLASESEDIISLGVGEPDFQTPESVKDAGIRAIEANKTHYSSNQGLAELREKIAERLEKENDIEASKDDVLITSGSSEALDVSLRAVLDPGDEVIIFDPAYVAYAPLITFAGGVPVAVPTSEDNGFKPRQEDIESKITDKTKALLFCTPNNPTGSVMGKKELSGLTDIIIKNDLVAISDEIYQKIIYDGNKHYSIASFPGMAKRTITLNGFSKAYASTGWRLGYAHAKGELFEGIKKIHQYCMLSSPSISQYAMLEAFDDRTVERMVREFDRRRKLLVKGLCDIEGIDCRTPEGAFYVFPNIRKTGMTSEEFAEHLIKKADVAVVPGNVFGKSGEGHVRCSYSVSLTEIKEAVRRISRAIE